MHPDLGKNVKCRLLETDSELMIAVFSCPVCQRDIVTEIKIPFFANFPNKAAEILEKLKNMEY